LIDYDKLQIRLIRLVNDGLGQGFAIGHLLERLRFLDIAVEDYAAAEVKAQEAFNGLRRFMTSFEDIEEALAARAADSEIDDAVERASIRLFYEIDSVYSAARRVLDRVVAVAHQLLPRSQTDLGNSHHGFHNRLEARCSELELEVPASLLETIDDLDDRIKSMRDRFEHPMSPRWGRWIEAGEELRTGTRDVVRVGEDARPTVLESPAELRDAIHAYALEMVDLLEAGRAARDV
jgi:hypothetical protein